MAPLKLRMTDEQRNPDALPFPGVGPARPWRPRADADLNARGTDVIREVEQAMAEVNRRFDNLRLLVDEETSTVGPNRPRAA